jgi:hypothetical protein
MYDAAQQQYHELIAKVYFSETSDTVATMPEDFRYVLAR